MTLKSRIISSIIIMLAIVAFNVVFFVTTINFDVNFYVRIVCFALNVPLIIASSIALGLNYHQMVRWMISASIILFIAAIAYLLILKFDLYSKFDSAQKIEIFLTKYGAWAGLIFIVIQFLQVTVVPLPGALTTVAGVALFGVWKTLLYSSIGIISGSLFAFFLGRKFGIKLMVWLCGKRVYDKYKKFAKGRDKIVLTMMFLFPFFPDDILCIAAGMTNMTYWQFFIIMLITRPLNILMMEGAFKGITAIPLTGYGIPIWIAIISVALIVVVIAFKYSDKIEGAMIKFFDKTSSIFARKRKKKADDIEPTMEQYSLSKSCYDKDNVIK
ncbi:MAG: TVP38/TMEM64 family protein [Clostridia bacterium]|nr:TVP38/TMEM64 family protein [Clostridia bacterium]MDE7328693.1 TVP38/TMEM64 family protein [Clostridia bacterium]